MDFNPNDAPRYLQGVEYQASKENLSMAAEQNGALEELEATRIMDARTTIPIHYNDYTRSESPLEDFKRAVTNVGLDAKVRYPSHGETYELEVPTAR